MMIKSLKDLITALRQIEPGLEYDVRFRFPDIYLRITDARLRDVEHEDRIDCLAKWLGPSWSPLDIQEVCFRAQVSLRLETNEERDPLDDQDRGDAWLQELLIDSFGGSYQPQRPDPPKKVETVHFYGYKGGQARSTVLTYLARTLAHEGYRVLVVDVDMEAPSLHTMIGAPPILRLENTLLGVSANCPKITPVNVPRSSRGEGVLDLIGCYPTAPDTNPTDSTVPEFAIESLALSLRSGMDPLWSSRCARRLDEIRREGQGYDLLIVDHRSGLSASCLPWMHALPGPVVVFARLDSQWMTAKPFLPALFRVYPPVPGLLVSFANQEDPDLYVNERYQQRDELLALLKRGLKQAPPDTARVGRTREDLMERFVVWPYDSELRRHHDTLPPLKDLGAGLRTAINEIRRLLELDRQKPSLHGGKDQLDLLPLPAVVDVLAENSSIRYILGRKGTGKTKLCHAMANWQSTERLIGHPVPQGELLLVDPGTASQDDSSETARDESEEYGLSVREQLPDNWKTKLIENPEVFCWLLLVSALAGPDTRRDRLRRELAEKLRQIDSIEPAQQALAKVLAQSSGRRRIFLIDGLEILLAPLTKAQRDGFVFALLRIVANIQSDRYLSERIDFRLFLRPDLIPPGHVNWEQQTYHQLVHLRWSSASVLNFLLLHLLKSLELEPLRKRFQKIIETQIQPQAEAINKLELDDFEAGRLLGTIFPEFVHWRDSRVPLVSFVKNYFVDTPASDGSPDAETRYPRVFLSFLEHISKPEKINPSWSLDKLLLEEGSPIPASLVLAAYLAAVKDVFRTHIEEEIQLQWPVAVEPFFSVMVEQQSPFDPDLVAKRIAEQTARGLGKPVSETECVQLLKALKDLGLFGKTQLQGQSLALWRASPLVQTALGMKEHA